MVRWVENQVSKISDTQTGQKLSTYPESAEISPCEIRSLLDYDKGQCTESSYLKYFGEKDSEATIHPQLNHLVVNLT